MRKVWIINLDRMRAIKFRKQLEVETGCTCLIGSPRPDGPDSTTDLEAMNIVGIYQEKEDEILKPSDNCLNCKDTGFVTLFTTVRECYCQNSNSYNEYENDNNDTCYWE